MDHNLSVVARSLPSMDGTTANANLAGWRVLLIQVGLLLLGAFSALVLFSFGGQIIVGPALLPVLWLIARNTRGVTSIVFSVVGALLAAEVAWMGLAVVVGEGASSFLNVLTLAGGAASGLFFAGMSRPGRAS